jgi:enamine deaminase RidA (YjgF/YER057c/UK114 family)
MDRMRAALGLNYLGAEEFEAFRLAKKGHVLGAIAFGSRPDYEVLDCPFAWIDLLTLEREAVFEVWTSKQPVVREVTGGIATARNEDLLFGCLQIDADTDLERSTHRAYCNAFDATDRLGYSHLLRVWHYFPRINDDADGLERYRRFNVGRHDAFLSRGRKIEEHAPAACALGTRSGPLTIYFLAARQPGQPVSNPRQCAPYHYPKSYGPRGPGFSRAMLAQTGGDMLLFISGTASIVDHQTLHSGDIERQAGETVRNLLAVVEQARFANPRFAGASERITFKSYVRDSRYLPAVRQRVAEAFGHDATVVYLGADICRSDLLVEVEGVYLTRTDA